MKLKAPSFSLKKSSQGILQFSNTGKYLAQMTSRILIWDIEKRKNINAIKAISNEQFVVFDCQDENIAIKNSNGELAFCNLESGEILSKTGKFCENRSGAQPAFTPDGKYLFDGDSRGRLQLWDVNTARAEYEWMFPQTSFEGLHFSAARHLYLCHAREHDCHQLWMIDADRLDVVQEKLTSSDFGVKQEDWWSLRCLNLSKDGKKLALIAEPLKAVQQPVLYVLDLTERIVLYASAVREEAPGAVYSMSWSYNDEYLALVFSESMYKKGMTHSEYEAIRKMRIWKFLDIHDVTRRECKMSMPLNGLSKIAFSPVSAAIALNGDASAYLSGIGDIEEFAFSQNKKSHGGDM